MITRPSQRTERIILIEPDDERRDALARRLQIQGFEVEPMSSASAAALAILADPPSAVVADLWMPEVSGVQICLLLRAEAATTNIPIILCGAEDTPRERFWAERAGASDYVGKGHIGALSRALRRAIAEAPEHDGFFQIMPASRDVRERIGALLDKTLFESVLASEIRALSTSDCFTQLFDLFSQLLCQVLRYRWLAVSTNQQMIVHCHPRCAPEATAEAGAELNINEGIARLSLEDEDAHDEPVGPVIVHALTFGTIEVGRVAMAPCDGTDAREIMELVSRELGGPIQIVSLVQETKRLASHDPLTGIFNRRAFTNALEQEMSRVERTQAPISLLLLDIDHFKMINDVHGHASGDAVLAAVGKLLGRQKRSYDLAARWGGEEFVLALPETTGRNALCVAERVRAALETMALKSTDGKPIHITASIGVACRLPGETLGALIERADLAMYSAKTNGRNRVIADPFHGDAQLNVVA